MFVRNVVLTTHQILKSCEKKQDALYRCPRFGFPKTTDNSQLRQTFFPHSLRLTSDIVFATYYVIWRNAEDLAVCRC